MSHTWLESNVTHLKTDDYPNGTKTREETMTALEAHFKKTFQKTADPEPRLGDEWFNGIKQITDDTKNQLDRKVTRNDITTAIFKHMGAGKSPGADGLSVEFYQKFWCKLVEPFYSSLMASVEAGIMSSSQRRSVIRLIAKKDKDLSKIKGWRPISLLCIDCKIYSKARNIKNN
jgi:hypothetical protein